MAIVNRTPDSFYAPGKTWDHTAALKYADEEVAAGADMVYVGGVPACPKGEADTIEEIRRTAPYIAALAAKFRLGYACTHAGSQPPRARYFRIAYQDIMREVIEKALDQLIGPSILGQIRRAYW
jgi:dihydropteroate synthase